jgi:Domain of unknown function (DUF6602)
MLVYHTDSHEREGALGASGRNENADLTGFAALLGDSFSSKIDLLAQIIQGHHYPSLGRYKERLLSKIIAEYVPNDYEVGTGFVLFVHDATEDRAAKPGFDRNNMGSFSISKQCDIIVYDSSRIPVVFRDDDFVVVRPESVKAVIEVKGTANPKEIAGVLRSFFDFGQKWRQCQLFYHEHHQPLTASPALYVMCWDVGKDTRGRPLTSGVRIRKQVAEFYRKNMDLRGLKGFPRISSLFVYNDSIISEMGWFRPHADGGIETGFANRPGKFLRHDSAGNPHKSGDQTIADLLAGLHYAVGDPFNRFFSYTDESRHIGLDEGYDQTFSSWLTDGDHIRDANTHFVVEK